MRLRALAVTGVLIFSCGGAPEIDRDNPDLLTAEQGLSSDCTGLVPALPARKQLTITWPTYTECTYAPLTGDASGALVPWSISQDRADQPTAFIYDATSGAQLGSMTYDQFLPETVGFAHAAPPLFDPYSSVYATDRTGAQTGHTTFGPAPADYDPHIGLDYSGGFSALLLGSHPYVHFQSFDSKAQPRSLLIAIADTQTSPPPQPFDYFTAVDLLGHVLVLYPGVLEGHGTGSLMARWFDRAGNSLTSSFAMGGWRPTTGSDEVRLSVLIGGGLALQKNGVFYRVFPSAKAYSQAVPAWLAAIHGHLQLARGAKAYAVMPTAVASDCSERVQIVAPAGNVCGSIALPAGGQCSFRKVDLARDGTLMQDRGCSQTSTLWWWPRALQ